MVKKWGKPALVEMWNERIFYFVMKYEWNFVDSTEKAAALTTDQMDVESAETYDISYVDRDGKKKKPIILHLSPTGALERIVYAILERAHLHRKSGKTPHIPLWLAPIQARLVPVSAAQVKYCEKLLSEFRNIRIDIDDTNDTLGKKIKKAEEEWVPYILVVGQKEEKSGKVSVRDRSTGKQSDMTVEAFVKNVHKQTEGMPFKPLPLPKLLSKRPIFVG
jgi:threonyl-tRNA synthetase